MLRFIVLVAIVISLPVLASRGDPLVYEIDMKTGHRRSGITQSQAREVTRFVRTIPGIDHRVLTINALDLPRVVVETGEWSQGRGDVVYLRREGQRWTLEKKQRWRHEDGITYEYE